jgi:hypothetical protein
LKHTIIATITITLHGDHGTEHFTSIEKSCGESQVTLAW